MGQEAFYQKLGYEECGPVSIYGFGSKLGLRMEQLSSQNSEESTPKSSGKEAKSSSEITRPAPNGPAPPPPPPPPSKLLGQEVMVKKTFMKKVLPIPCGHEHKTTATISV